MAMQRRNFSPSSSNVAFTSFLTRRIMTLVRFILHALLVLSVSSSIHGLRAAVNGNTDTPEIVDSSTPTAVTVPCPQHCRSIKVGDSSNLHGARIFYAIFLHDRRTASDAIQLIRALRDPRNILYVHVDAKATRWMDEPILEEADHFETTDASEEEDEATKGTRKAPTSLRQELEQCPCGSRTKIESVHSAVWSEWSMNLPTLRAMEVATTTPEFRNEWDRFINLSADTRPVYTNNYVAEILAAVAPYNFVTSRSCATGLLPTNIYFFPEWWMKRRHYTESDTVPSPTFEVAVALDGSIPVTVRGTEDATTTTLQNVTLTYHTGSQWIILRPDFCSWLVDQMKDPKSITCQFRDYLVAHGRKMTDEFFIATLLTQVPPFNQTLPMVDSQTGELLFPNGTASGMYSIRYERMDENMPNWDLEYISEQRYEVPETIKDSHSISTNPWGPYFLGVYDLGDIRDSGALFVRKISALVDPNMVALLPVSRREDIPHIYWPDEVAVSKKVDWDSFAEDMKEGREDPAQDEEIEGEGDEESDDDEEEL